MKKIVFAFAVSIVVLASVLVGCSSEKGEFVFADMDHVKSFPKEYTLGAGQQLDLDVLGVTDFRCIDEYLLVSSESGDGMVKVFDKKDYSLLGSFFKSGNGPGELIFPPYFIDWTVGKAGNDIICRFVQLGKVYTFNLTQSLRDNMLVCHTSPLSDKLLQYQKVILLNDTSEVYGLRISEDMDQYIREFLSGDEVSSPEFLEPLNSVEVPDKNDGFSFNYVGTYLGYSPAQNLIVEAGIYLNIINIYSPDGKFAKSLCIGSKPWSVEEIFSQEKEDRHYAFSNFKVFDNIMAGLYVDEVAKNVDMAGKATDPTLMIFSVNGKPLAEIKTGKLGWSFCIDTADDKLYTYDPDTDKISVHELPRLAE